MAKQFTTREITVVSFDELNTIVYEWHNYVNPFGLIRAFPNLLDVISGPFHYVTFRAVCEGAYTPAGYRLYQNKMKYIEEIHKAVLAKGASYNGTVLVNWKDHNPTHTANIVTPKSKKIAKETVIRSVLWAF